MVEAVDVSPGLEVVASLATKRSSIHPLPRHLLVKLALVRILMTSRAGQVREMERQDGIRAPAQACLMALGTGHSRMGSRERETRVAMFGDRIGCAVPFLDRVAIFTAILERGAGELAVVRILVAVRAECELHFVKRIFACRDVALRAFHINVLAPQRVLGSIVLAHTEKGRLPT